MPNFPSPPRPSSAQPASHTPGPWLVNHCTSRGTPGIYRWEITREEGRDAEVLATVPVHWNDGEGAEARAYLVAAAPDLLAALRGMLELRQVPKDTAHTIEEWNPEAFAAARAALAKAQS